MTQEVTADSSGEWKFSFDDLALRSASGERISYTLREDKVPGYTQEIDQVNYKIINTHVPEELTIPVLKVWDDGDDVDKKRPQDITVELLADEEVLERLVLSEENDWQGAFSHLAKFSEGKEIAYVIREVEVEGYESRIEGSIEEGFVIKNFYSPQSTTEPDGSSDTSETTSSETTNTSTTNTSTSETTGPTNPTGVSTPTTSPTLSGPAPSETKGSDNDLTGTGIREQGLVVGSILLLTAAVFIRLKRKMKQDQTD
jgi:hypothetical protein